MKKNKNYFPFSLTKNNLPQYILHQSKDPKYSGIVENSVHSFFLIDMDGGIAESNHAATVMFGYSPAEFKALKRWNIIDHNNPCLLAALQDGEKNRFAITEATGIKKKGEQFPVEITSTFFKDSKGKESTCCMVTDLSLHKNTEAALRLSKERYDLVIKATKDLVWDWDLVTGEIYRNDSSLFDVYGLKSNKAIKNIGDWSGFIHPLDKEKIIELIDHYVNSAEENDFVFEYRFRKEDGTYAYISDKGYIIRNAKGKAIRMIGAAENITERKQTELAILASEERYRNLFNNSPSNIIIWDMDDYRILEVNETAIDMYGYTREEFLQKTILDIRAIEEHPKMARLVEEAGKAEDFKRSILCKTHTKRGMRLFMDITAYKIVFNGKHVILTQGNNVTEKIQLENSLNEERQIRHQQITEAVIAGQEKERTEIGEELHDNINQILASTKLYIECSLKDKNPRTDLVIESKLLLEKAMKEIRKLSKSLLPPSLGEVGLLQALQELVENIKQVNELVISIRWDIEENSISAKLKLTIFRIVQEQMNNVIKHAHAKNSIISITKEAGQIQLSIKDDGQGFDTSLKRVGVGLRNISSRAEVNNGTVAILSGPGKGCELIVTFTGIEIFNLQVIPA